MNKPNSTDCRPTYVERLDRLIKPMTKSAEGLSDEQWEDYDSLIFLLCQIDEVNERNMNIYDLMAQPDDYSDLREPMR